MSTFAGVYPAPKPTHRKRKRTYGGASAEFPTVQEFRKRIFQRDLDICYVCGDPACGPRELAHLTKRVGMGGRSKSTVNYLWNACVAGRECARKTDVDMDLCRELTRRLCEERGYVLPDGVLE